MENQFSIDEAEKKWDREVFEDGKKKKELKINVPVQIAHNCVRKRESEREIKLQWASVRFYEIIKKKIFFSIVSQKVRHVLSMWWRFGSLETRKKEER